MVYFSFLLPSTSVFAQPCNAWPQDPISSNPTLCEQFGSNNYTLDWTFIKTSHFPGPGTTVSNTVVRISVDFEVDNEFTFEGCIISVRPGVKINVLSKLILRNCKLFACNQMWGGIVAQPFGKVVINNNTVIEDAQYAVLAYESSFLDITNTRFSRNYIGIKLTVTSPNAKTAPRIINLNNNTFNCYSPITPFLNFSYLNNPYPGQTPTPGKVTAAGILASNTVATIGGTGNVFKNMYSGIAGINGKLSVRGCYFESCGIIGVPDIDGNSNLGSSYGGGIVLHNSKLSETGFGYSSSAPVAFLSCAGGVLALDSDVDISNNHFKNCEVSAYVSDDKKSTVVLIKNNLVNCPYDSNNRAERRGVVIQSSSNAVNAYGSKKILYNTLSIGNPQAAETGINCAFAGYIYEPVDISWNSVGGKALGTAISLKAGSISEAGNPIKITNNTINSQNMNVGIKIEPSKGFAGNYILVSSNNILANTQEACIFVDKSINVKLEQNILPQSSGTGISVETSKNIPIVCNGIGTHDRGLAIINSDIGVQNHHANAWNPNIPQQSLSAYYDGKGVKDPLLSRFIVATLPPRIQVVNPATNNAWFQQLPANETNCPQTPLGELDGSDRYLITHYIQGNTQEEWSNAYELYERLRAFPALLDGDAEAGNFVSHVALGNVGKRYTIDSLITKAKTLDSAQQAYLAQLIARRDSLLDMLAQVQDQLSADSSALSILLPQYDLLTGALINTDSTLSAVRYQYYSATLPLLQLAQNINNTLSPATPFQANDKSLNAIKLQAMVSGTGLTPADMDIIRIIAAQDPETGGIAVITARKMLPLCEMAQYEGGLLNRSSTGEDTQNTWGMAPEFGMVPNPGSGMVRIEFYDDPSAALLRITNQAGQVVMNRAVQGLKAVELDVSMLPAGLYFCTRYAEGQTPVTQKLILMK